MKILHTADLHLGQVMYQNYSREDEHDYFFAQLKQWCREHNPDALLVSGDIFDIQQPGASTKQAFNQYFADIHNSFPQINIVIIAGNHDSASRIQADNVVWGLSDVTLIGRPPASDISLLQNQWQEHYIVRIPNKGYIVALPYMVMPKKATFQSLLDYVASENSSNLPVIMMGHLAVTGTDTTGHDFDIGHLQTHNPEDLGDGYDYLALGHIHRPQTINRPNEEHLPISHYPAGVIRYSGSALHVSCDECYPHTVSLVEIDHHGGAVQLTRLRINELRHFYQLPDTHSIQSEQEALDTIKAFAEEHHSGYIRLTISYNAFISSNFTQQVYKLLESYHNEVRYNPRIIWTDIPLKEVESTKPIYEVADLQQMVDPMQFIEKTLNHYPDLTIEELREAFREIEIERVRLQEETH